MNKIKPTDGKQVVQAEGLPVVRSANFLSLYINNTKFGYTQWDIQMVCSQLIITADMSKAQVEELATLTMSPQHAKAMYLSMANNLRLYEAEHGEIVLPTQVVATLADQHKSDESGIIDGLPPEAKVK